MAMSVPRDFTLFDQQGKDKTAEILFSIILYLAISLTVNFTKCLGNQQKAKAPSLIAIKGTVATAKNKQQQQQKERDIIGLKC